MTDPRDATIMGGEDIEALKAHFNPQAGSWIARLIASHAALADQLAARDARIGDLTRALERAYLGLQCWQKDQRDDHPESVDGWLIMEEVEAALAAGGSDATE